MAIDALVIATNNVPDPDGVMRVETGETLTVWKVDKVYFDTLEEVNAYLENPPEGYVNTRKAPYPITTGESEDAVTTYMVRMKYQEEVPEVEGGAVLDADEDLGGFNLFRVRCQDDGLPSIHTATVEANAGAGGALQMQAVGDYAALPAIGEPVTAGVIYNDIGNLVVARQSHTRTEHPVDTIPALFAVWRTGSDGDLDWVAGEGVEVGMRRYYDGVLYECLQAHQTQSDWTPPAVPALWKVVVIEEPTADWTPGVAYAVDDVALYNEQEWRCTQAHTALAHWYPGAPGVYLWELVE